MKKFFYLLLILIIPSITFAKNHNENGKYLYNSYNYSVDIEKDLEINNVQSPINIKSLLIMTSKKEPIFYNDDNIKQVSILFNSGLLSFCNECIKSEWLKNIFFFKKENNIQKISIYFNNGDIKEYNNQKKSILNVNIKVNNYFITIHNSKNLDVSCELGKRFNESCFDKNKVAEIMEYRKNNSSYFLASSGLLFLFCLISIVFYKIKQKYAN